jgi:hypothetical protein
MLVKNSSLLLLTTQLCDPRSCPLSYCFVCDHNCFRFIPGVLGHWQPANWWEVCFTRSYASLTSRLKFFAREIYFQRDKITQTTRQAIAIMNYMQKLEESEGKFRLAQSKKLEEVDLETYLSNEGYTWNYVKLTIPLLTNFLSVKGVRYSKSLKRSDYIDLAKNYITLNPNPSSMSVCFDPVEKKFIPNGLVSAHQEADVPALLPELVSATEHPYDYSQRRQRELKLAS